MQFNYPRFSVFLLKKITVVYLIKDYKTIDEVKSSGCFFFSESKVSNHMGRQTDREQSREKSQCLQYYFSGNA